VVANDEVGDAARLRLFLDLVLQVANDLDATREVGRLREACMQSHASRPKSGKGGAARGRRRGRCAPAAGAARREALVESALGQGLGVVNATVARVWREWDPQPWRVETSTFQVQAPDRTVPILPLRTRILHRRTHDYVRHGTTRLFAALEVATGKVG
jgi:hypothetical protein